MNTQKEEFEAQLSQLIDTVNQKETQATSVSSNKLVSIDGCLVSSHCAVVSLVSLKKVGSLIKWLCTSFCCNSVQRLCVQTERRVVRK